MGCPGGLSKIHCTRFVLEKWSLTVYFLGKRPSLLHPNTAQRSFLPITILFQENFKEKSLKRYS